MDKDIKKANEDFEYTIVMDATYIGPDAKDLAPVQAAEEPQPAEEDSKAAADRLYDEYEKMCLKDPNVLDKDDIYPHTYQWRAGDRYDPAKVEVVQEAVKRRSKIAETDAYRKYVEEVTKRKFSPDSWD